MGIRRRDERQDEELDQGPEVDDVEEVRDAEFTEGLQEAAIKVAKYLERVKASAEIQGAVILDLTRKGEASQRNLFRARYHLDDALKFAQELLGDVDERIQTVYGRIEITLRVLEHPQFESLKFFLRRPQPNTVAGELGDNIYAPNELPEQLMDHVQVITTRLLQKTQADDAGLRADIREKNKRIAELEKNQTHYLAMIGKLARMEWLIESEREDKKERRQRSDQLFKMGIPIAMAMISKIAGGDPNMAPMMAMLAGGAVAPAPPGGAAMPFGAPPGMGPPTEGSYPSYASPAVPSGPTELEKVVADLFGTLTQEQFVQFASSPDLFKPDQIVLLMQIGKMIADKKEAWTSSSTSTTAVANGAPSPEAVRSTPKVHEGELEDEPWTGGFTFTPRTT